MRGRLRGFYIWPWDGYRNPGGNLVPKTLMIGIQFNGDGKFHIRFSKVNIGGAIIIDAAGSDGTYTVAADCTGTLSSHRRPKL